MTGRRVGAGDAPSSPGRGPGGGRDVREPAEEGVQCGVGVVDGSAFVVNERDGGERALEIVPGFQELGLA
ncbi:MAG: hypothetical protein ABSB76_11115 [Streptosporangiaceae bacterium]|jgi:hypothetical protein